VRRVLGLLGSALTAAVMLPQVLTGQSRWSLEISPQNATRAAGENASPGTGSCQQFVARMFEANGKPWSTSSSVWTISDTITFALQSTTTTGLVCARQTAWKADVSTQVTVAAKEPHPSFSWLHATTTFTVTAPLPLPAREIPQQLREPVGVAPSPRAPPPPAAGP
jgi:hypothetical protein